MGAVGRGIRIHRIAEGGGGIHTAVDFDRAEDLRRGEPSRRSHDGGGLRDIAAMWTESGSQNHPEEGGADPGESRPRRYWALYDRRQCAPVNAVVLIGSR